MSWRTRARDRANFRYYPPARPLLTPVQIYYVIPTPRKTFSLVLSPHPRQRRDARAGVTASRRQVIADFR